MKKHTLYDLDKINLEVMPYGDIITRIKANSIKITIRHYRKNDGSFGKEMITVMLE